MSVGRTSDGDIINLQLVVPPIILWNELVMYFAYTTDILEDSLPVEVLNILLKDQSTGRNIFWATSDYETRGEGFGFFDEIAPEKITGANGRVIMPRVLKSKDTKKKRTKEKAEIFTPAWICNDMCNAGDEAHRAKGSHFNQPFDENGKNNWRVCSEPIRFADGVTWQGYVSRNILEITCGEAPYIVSRYDASTGEAIDIERRVGLLDRKLRIINENTSTFEEWLEWGIIAFQSSYGYEWQGDNILLARENLLTTFSEYYEARWQRNPSKEEMLQIAEIISWNIFQMDGLKMVIPESCKHDVLEQSAELFGQKEVLVYCEGCKKKDPKRHNGIPALIKDWTKNEVIEFRSVLKRGSWI